MDGSWWPNLTWSSGYCNMSFVAKYPGTASNQIFVVEIGLIQSICGETCWNYIKCYYNLLSLKLTANAREKLRNPKKDTFFEKPSFFRGEG